MRMLMLLPLVTRFTVILSTQKNKHSGHSLPLNICACTFYDFLVEAAFLFSPELTSF